MWNDLQLYGSMSSFRSREMIVVIWLHFALFLVVAHALDTNYYPPIPIPFNPESTSNFEPEFLHYTRYERPLGFNFNFFG
jgi:hypothetical protein